MDAKYPNIHVQVEVSDSTMDIINQVRDAMDQAGVPESDVDAFLKDAPIDNPEYVLKSAGSWVTLEVIEDEPEITIQANGPNSWEVIESEDLKQANDDLAALYTDEDDLEDDGEWEQDMMDAEGLDDEDLWTDGYDLDDEDEDLDDDEDDWL